MENKLLYKEEVYAIQGAIFEVYKEMGNDWNEEVYQQCMERELEDRGIPFDAKKTLPIFYKGKAIEKTYEPDLWCFGKIIVELKAVGALAEEHRRQILNYLRMTISQNLPISQAEVGRLFWGIGRFHYHETCILHFS